MWKTLVSILILAGAMSRAGAQTITDFNEVAAKLHFWAQETGDPVYYGEVRNVAPGSLQVLGHYQCLALGVHQERKRGDFLRAQDVEQIPRRLMSL